MRWTCLTVLCWALVGVGCGPDQSTQIAIRIHMAAPADRQLRGFTPDNPPVWVAAEVVRSSELSIEAGTYQPEASVQPAWADMETDPVTGRRYLLLDVAPNAGQADPYLLRVASLVPDGLDQPVPDACGVVGGIETSTGEKKSVDLVAHTGDCQMICANDLRCVGPRYCLGFECQAPLAQDCTADADCPNGAWCDGTSCSGRCGDLLPDCRSGYRCCAGVCAPSCG
jgi:hypothetical protein